MVYFGKVKHGKIETDPGVSLPEGAIVRIEPVNGAAPTHVPPDPFDSLGEDAVDTGIPDLAREHDHYASGAPKRGPGPQNGR